MKDTKLSLGPLLNAILLDIYWQADHNGSDRKQDINPTGPHKCEHEAPADADCREDDTFNQIAHFDHLRILVHFIIPFIFCKI